MPKPRWRKSIRLRLMVNASKRPGQPRLAPRRQASQRHERDGLVHQRPEPNPRENRKPKQIRQAQVCTQSLAGVSPPQNRSKPIQWAANGPICARKGFNLGGFGANGILLGIKHMPNKPNAILNLIRSRKRNRLLRRHHFHPRHRNKSGLTSPYQFYQEVEEVRLCDRPQRHGNLRTYPAQSRCPSFGSPDYPADDHIVIRIVALHPNVTFELLDPAPQPVEAPVQLGGIQSTGLVRLQNAIFELEVEVNFLHATPKNRDRQPLVTWEPGQQLAFQEDDDVSFIGTLIDSVTGPGSGGHAIPALSQEGGPERSDLQKLTLRSSKGYRSVYMEPEMLEKGILIGRSRRCKLGRQYSDQDGLSRIHAMVIELEGKIYALDLASKYGLRDVTKPTVKVHAARLDNQIGCLVYGAGHLVIERG